ISPKVGKLVHPSVPPEINPPVSSARAPATLSWPGRSNGARWRAVLGRFARASNTLTAPMGRLITKTLRQPNASISRPPTSGPTRHGGGPGGDPAHRGRTALDGVAEQVGDQRQRRGEHGRRSDSLGHSSRDEQPDGRRQRTRGGRRGEQRDAEQESAAQPEP